MRVFMTGATGFVGSQVARLLVSHGHEVHALVVESEDEERRACKRLGREGANVTRIHGDLLRPITYMPALEALQPEACVHVGWYANPADYLTSRVNLDLLGASVALAEKLIELGTRRIVGVGTCFEYDTALGYLSESSALRPRHLYSTCKRALFDIMTHLTQGSPTTFAWTRLFFLYGPFETPGRLVPSVLDAMLTGKEVLVTMGEQIRDFLHVRDAAAGIVHVLETDEVSGPVNVASGRPVTVRQVVETAGRVCEAVGAPTPRVRWGAIASRPEDPTFVCANVKKLEASGFRPSLDLEAGMHDVVRRAQQS